MFAIKFEDGSYNQGVGYEVPLKEATRYPSREKAEEALTHLTDGEIVEVLEVPCTIVPTELWLRILDELDGASLCSHSKIPALLTEIRATHFEVI